MGLHVPVAEFLLVEHLYKKIEGDILFIGRQTTFQDEDSLARLMAKYNLSLPTGFTYEYDTETRGASERRYITDRCFMRAIGVTKKVNFLDVTDYEGADIVHDLGYPVPSSLEGRYDFIFNGGCFDNMFNPGVAITNLSKMLRPGGRVVCFESADSWNSPYLMYSPGWFWDYYVTNAFADSKIYIGSFHDGDELAVGPWDWYYINMQGAKCTWQETNGPAPAARENNHLVIISIAEKGEKSTADRQPIQLQYRVNEALAQECKRNAEAMRSSLRPVVLASEGQKFDHYATYLGKLGKGFQLRSFTGQKFPLVRRSLRAMKVISRILLNQSVV